MRTPLERVCGRLSLEPSLISIFSYTAVGGKRRPGLRRPFIPGKPPRPLFSRAGSGLCSCALCDKWVSSLQESSGCPLCPGPPRRLPPCFPTSVLSVSGSGSGRCCLLQQEEGTTERERGPCAGEAPRGSSRLLVAPCGSSSLQKEYVTVAVCTSSRRLGRRNQHGGWFYGGVSDPGGRRTWHLRAGAEAGGGRASAASCGEDAVPACPMWKLCVSSQLGVRKPVLCVRIQGNLQDLRQVISCGLFRVYFV